MLWHLTALLVTVMAIENKNSLKILMVPQPLNSHYLMFGRVATALIHQGHDIAIVLPNNTQTFLIPDQVDIYTYEGVGAVNILNSPETAEILVKSTFATSMIEFYNIMFNMDELVVPVMNQECRNLLDDQALREQFISQKFDFAIVDQIGFPCIMNYPIILGLDYFLFSIPMFSWASRVPELPSFLPEVYAAKYNDQMTFVDRMLNTIFYIAAYSMVNTTNPIDMTKYPPGRPSLDLMTIQERAVFWFWLDDPALSFVRPHMPNTVSIGDIMVKEGEVLPDHFQSFIQSASEGTILVSFGSFLDHIPDDIIDKFCVAFAQVRQKVIWKSKIPPPCTERLKHKMMVVSWMPQNDILAHPNLKLFITHCGLNSMLEAVYHAKPMIGFPISLDQPYNAKILEAKKYGLVMDVTKFSSQEVVDNVNKIINDDEIAKRLHMGANLIRDKPESPEQRIGYWLNHVAKYGSDHLRSGAYKLSLTEFLMLDVLLAFVIIVIAIIVALACVICCICKCCKRCLRRNSFKHKME